MSGRSTRSGRSQQTHGIRLPESQSEGDKSKQDSFSTRTPGRTSTQPRGSGKRKRSSDGDGNKSRAGQKQDDAASKSKVARTQGKGVKVEPDLEAGAKLAASILPDSADAVVDAPPSGANASPSKANSYGLSPGESPYPNYSHPTPKECEKVAQLLSSEHGQVSVPKSVPAPSLNSSGCGEVPSVLDALVRTRLSAATNNSNSSRAFRGLVEAFGTAKAGAGKGSVDWEKVRTANVKEVFEAIRTGGLADVKSRDIQKILQMVYEENQTKGMTKGLSLDHLHDLPSDEAFSKLLNYPGIGPKTASCVLLFCMQRPSFAVDTHVFRLAGFLGWIPTDAQAKTMYKKGEAKAGTVTRNSTYSHLEVRVPDHLKYPLHYLLIKHGKTCPYCSAKKDKAVSKAWGTKTCPLRREGLIGSKSKKSEVKDEADGD